MRFVVCGENLIDLISQEEISPAETRWSALAGGGPLNTSVALARLGEETHFLGRLGADAFGAQIERHLVAGGVELDLAVRSSEPTSLAVVSLDKAGRASYTFHFEGTSGFSWSAAEFPVLTGEDWLHFGSIGFVAGAGVRPLLDFVRNTEAAVSYDLNIRPSVIPDRAEYFDLVMPLLEAVGRNGGIAKASDEDICWLVDETDPIPFAEAWAEEFGLAMFIITLGPDGAVAVKPDGRIVRVPGRRVDLVDTVGAGDTFMAGFLQQYTADPQDVERALHHGVAASALVCARKGANPPTRDEVLTLLAG